MTTTDTIDAIVRLNSEAFDVSRDVAGLEYELTWPASDKADLRRRLHEARMREALLIDERDRLLRLLPSPVLVVLRAARALIASPDRHTTLALARDASGRPLVSVHDPAAVRWSAEGAILRYAAGGPEQQAALDAYGDAMGLGWTGQEGHAEVLAGLQRAIAKREAIHGP